VRDSESFVECGERISALGRNIVGGGEGVGGGKRSAPPRPAASSRLEPSDSNLKSNPPVSLVAVCPTMCRCRTCEKCGPRLGWRVRQNMLAKSGRFRTAAMLSLTVDRKHFASPEEAHRVITHGTYIATLMRLLGLKTWFWVLEFQTKTGDGWPHWHILIDLGDVNGRLDLVRAWRLWRDKWKLGGLDLSTKQSFADPEHAVNYITKYLTKMPEAFPVWVLARTKAIRFVGGCKALGSLTGQPSRVRPELEPIDQMNLPFREPRSILLVRMAKCEMSVSVFGVSGDNLRGEGEWKWMGTILATPNDLVDLAEQGLVSLRVAAVDWGEREMLVITDASVGGVIAALRRVKHELADRDVGYAPAWEDCILHREGDLLEHHAGYWWLRCQTNLDSVAANASTAC
jgi:hypothetical protein